MSIITDLTRMWLTRSAKPFLFQNEYDQQLPFSQCEGLGLYVHIPFCRELCGFCPYCKVQYDRAVCDRYLDRLIQEIHLVGGQLPGRKRVTSLYFGGGTPALAAGRLKEVMEAIAHSAGCGGDQDQHRGPVLPEKVPGTAGTEACGPPSPAGGAVPGPL